MDMSRFVRSDAIMPTDFDSEDSCTICRHSQKRISV